MEELVHKGLVKSIGVSNFSPEKIQKLLETAVIRPAVNQVRGCANVCAHSQVAVLTMSEAHSYTLVHVCLSVEQDTSMCSDM